MIARPLAPRVDRLEEMMAELTQNVNRLSLEMRVLEKEMRVLEKEMSDFRREMSDFKKEIQLQNQRHNEKMAEISASTGRMVEDLVAPSIIAFFEHFADTPEPPILWGVRMRRRAGNRIKEFDVVVVIGDYILINETKKVLRPEDIPNFLETLREVRLFFPEYADKKIIGAMATLWIDESLLRYGERQGLIMLGMSKGLLQVLNSESFKPGTF